MAPEQHIPAEQPSGYWWLSFVDHERPEGEQFLGAAIVLGSGIVEALMAAWLLGCNPGGEVEGVSILAGRVPSEPWLNRLLSKGEALELSAWANQRWPDDA